MSRSVRDLRELICISRLTIRESDEEEDVISDDNTLACDGVTSSSANLDKKRYVASNLDWWLNESKGNSTTPDSGFSMTNGFPQSDPTTEEDLEDGGCSDDDGIGFAAGRQNKKKTKRMSKFPAMTHSFPLRSPLPSVGSSSYLKMDQETRLRESERSPRESLDRASTPSMRYAEGHYEELLIYIDGAVVADWLQRANDSVIDMSRWCHHDDNFVEFANFWLTDFADIDKFNILRLEYQILGDELAFAFAAGVETGHVKQRHLAMFLDAVLREYPARLLSSRGAHLFIDHLDVLTSGKRDAYRRLLADVKCSTRVPQHIQWILAIRSFALVSLWSAIVRFYEKLCCESDSSSSTSQPLPSDVQLVNEHRMQVAIWYVLSTIFYVCFSNKIYKSSECE